MLSQLPTIKFKGQEYIVKKRLKFGEVFSYQETLGNLIGMDKRIRNATDEQLTSLAEEGQRKTLEQMKVVSDTIFTFIDYRQEQLNELDFVDAVVLFNEIYTAATTPKKKLEQPSDSPTP